jgi:transcriptional regulator with XRE-family HTH domain
MHKSEPTSLYDVALLRLDMTEKGWLPIDLARAAKVSHMTVSRFLSGERQTPRAAKKLATALNRSVRRYLLSAREAIAS